MNELHDLEPVYVALAALLAAVPGVNRFGRRLVHWANVDAADHPAIFMAQAGETPEQRKGLPPKWKVTVEVYVYVHVPEGDDEAPSTKLNRMLAGIREALEPSPVSGVPSGLLGLCSHAWIEGQIELFDAVLGSQAVAVVPVSVLTV